ncbi:MAG: peptide deformylase, partial [Candidatus Blackburnbacteria bacterium]|nr:peptide deformylase [Candidatus Blackburnbacteria bacterium]
MAVRKVITTKDGRLRERSRPVQEAGKKLIALIKDLKDTLLAQDDPEGVGLAAPQIGVNLRVFVMRYLGRITPIINPEILSVSEKTNDPEEIENSNIENRKSKNDHIMEGCLSLPHYYGPVKRSWKVALRYQTLKMENGKWKMENTTKSFSGFPAQIIQHEVDHLDGKIFIDRLLEQKRKLYELRGKEWEEVE